MKTVKCLVILMALAYCVEGRERLGKIIKRQARHRDYKAIQSPQTGAIHQSVVRNSFVQPQSQLSSRPTYGSEITVPLNPPAVGQAQYQQAQQQAAQPTYSASQIPQNQYQPFSSQSGQLSYEEQQQISQNQYQPTASQSGQLSYEKQQQISQNQYQPTASQSGQLSYEEQQQISQIQYQPISSPQVQQGQQDSYREISLVEALKTPRYNQLGQAALQAYQQSPVYAQPIAMRDVSNKILMRLPSNASYIRPNIIDGFSCKGKPYGYYADIVNECQIFHVCFPLRSVFNNDPRVPDSTYEYSFICNEFTRFSQDALTCAWAKEAVPCKDSETLYSINDHFFKITTPKPIAGPIGGSVLVPGGLPGTFYP